MVLNIIFTLITLRSGTPGQPLPWAAEFLFIYLLDFYSWISKRHLKLDVAKEELFSLFSNLSSSSVSQLSEQLQHLPSSSNQTCKNYPWFLAFSHILCLTLSSKLSCYSILIFVTSLLSEMLFVYLFFLFIAYLIIWLPWRQRFSLYPQYLKRVDT